MHLTKTKIEQLECIASKFNVNPDLLVDALLDIGLKRTKQKCTESIKTKKLTPEQKVKAIEEEALSKGWTYEQLWRKVNYPRYDLKGLICFIDENTTIGEVTEKHIALIHERPVGGPVILNFYNQDWITKIEKSVLGNK